MIEDFEVNKIGEEVSKNFSVFKDDKDLKNLLTLLFHDEGKTRDTLDLFELLPVKYFIRIIKMLNGRRVRFIDYENLQLIFKTAILYLEIDQEKNSWEDVKKKYPEWDIDRNRDKHLLNKMINSLKENANKIFQMERCVNE